MMNDLTTRSGAQQALDAATTVPEMLELHTTLTTLKKYAESRGLGVEAENQAAEAILRTERKIGQWIIDRKASGDIREGNPTSARRSGSQPVRIVADLGIEYTAAQRYQRIADVDKDEFEAMIAEKRASNERIAKVDFYRTAKAPTVELDMQRTQQEPGFAAFRDGAYLLLGWKVDVQGVGASTKNGMLVLPNDELAQVADLLQRLVAAYQEARRVRSQ